MNSTSLFNVSTNASADSNIGLQTSTNLVGDHGFYYGHEPEKPNLNRPRTIRRLEGFLVSLDGDEAVVCFVQNNQPVEMVIPSRPLMQNGIVVQYQPFEFSEQEVHCNGYWQQVFLYKPLRDAKDKIMDSISLSEDARKKLDKLLKHV